MKCTMFKRLAALGLCCMVATSVSFAANTIKKTITVEYSGIKLVVDGVEVTPKDANGATVEPFVYNGTTYLPVRAVGNAIGKEVGWDGTTQTVYLGDIPGQSSNKYLDPYQTNYASVYQSDAAKSFSMMGEKYTQGVRFWGTYTGNYAYYNLNGHYSRISFDVGHIDNVDTRDGTLYVYADGEIVQQIGLTGDMQTKHVEVDVNYALQVKLVKSEGTDRGAGEYAVANVMGIE